MVSTDPRSELNLAREKRKLFTAFLSLLGLLIAAFLIVGGAFYSARRGEFTEGTQKIVSNVVTANSANLAMELFVNRTSAYELRLKDLQEKLGSVVTSPNLCLVDARGKVVAGTRADCQQIFRGRASGINLPIIESDVKVGDLLITYRDPFHLSNLLADYSWHIAAIFCSFAIALLALIGFFRRYMGKVFDRVSIFERQATMGQTAQMLAHDIQTPLNVLQHGLNIINETDDPDKVKRLAKNTLPAVQKSKKQIQNMLADLREIGAAKELELKNLSIGLLINDTLGDVKVLFDYLDIDLKYQFDHTGGIRGDEHKLGRVFSNILVNAVQVMQGEGEISFHTKNIQVHDKPFIEVRVTNSGSFIPEDERASIFSTFYSKGKKKGTGLGLAIVQKIVNEHGGKSYCDSDREIGTTIKFTIPSSQALSAPQRIVLPPRLSSEEDSPKENNTRILGRGKPALNILIADDDAYFLNAAKNMIEQNCSTLMKQYDLKIESVKTPSEVLEAVARRSPDIIFLDIDFGDPYLDGHQILKQLRENQCKSVIIVNTNSPSLEDQHASEQLGADAHLQKPVSAQQLITTLQCSGIVV